MASATKNLTVLNQTIDINSPSETRGVLSIQYGLNGAGGAGTGTIVVEARNNDTQPWVIIAVDTTGTPVTSAMSIAAAGLYKAEAQGYEMVRVRMSVVGDVVVTLNWGENG